MFVRNRITTASGADLAEVVEAALGDEGDRDDGEADGGHHPGGRVREGRLLLRHLLRGDRTEPWLGAPSGVKGVGIPDNAMRHGKEGIVGCLLALRAHLLSDFPLSETESGGQRAVAGWQLAAESVPAYVAVMQPVKAYQNPTIKGLRLTSRS
jgi:hypothetical protein